ncbi:MAG: DUF2190 family protein [Desulfobacterales bacterium]|nr:DUF2190 family protein [Desulfobacterales bacterium]
MAKNYIQKGRVLDFENTTGSLIPSGAPVAIEDMVGVAQVDMADTETGSVAVAEVWELPKLTGTAIPQGKKVYLAPGGKITLTEGGNTYAGKAAAGAKEDAALIQVLLNA